MKPAAPLDPASLPERIEEVMEPASPSAPARCVAFNRYGTLLAAGCDDGTVAVWDMDTRGIARTVRAHSQPVTCVAWSRCGHYVLSGAADRTLALASVLPRAAPVVWRSGDLGAPPTHASLLPPPAAAAVASFATGAPIVVSTRDAGGGAGAPLPTLPPPPDARGAAAAAAPGGVPPVTAAALADPTRRVVYVGAARGVVLAVDPTTRAVLDGVRVGITGAGSAAAVAAAGPRVQTLALSPCGTRLLAVCHDRVVRSIGLATAAAFDAARAAAPAPRTGAALAAALASAAAAAAVMRSPGSFMRGGEGDGAPPPLLSPGREFTQAVDRPAWRSASASSGGAFVAAAAASRADHHVYVFDAATSELDRVLSGPVKDPAAAAVWHPRGALLVSVGAATGRLYAWSPAFRENWAAFAPGFVELSENEEYQEREDEFDLNPRTDGGPGPGGVRPPPFADDGSGDDASVPELDAPVPSDEEAASVTSEGKACLVRLPLEVWAEDGGEGEEGAAGDGGGGFKRKRDAA